MADLRQIERDIKRRLKAFDFQSAFEHSTDEAKTRHYLINPFFEILGYEVGYGNGQLVTEYDADYGSMKGKKVDYAILFRNKPNIIIESLFFLSASSLAKNASFSAFLIESNLLWLD